MSQTPPYLLSILEEHLEELQMLWELRQTAVCDPDYQIGDVAELDDRIEAHTDGLVLGGEHALPLLEQGLGGEEPPVVFAAACVLLRLGDPAAAEKVVDALCAAEGEALDGFRQAFCHGPIDPVRDRLRETVRSAPAPAAVTAAEALAFHEQLDREPERLIDWLEDQSPEVRCAAWRVAAILDSGTRSVDGF